MQRGNERHTQQLRVTHRLTQSVYVYSKTDWKRACVCLCVLMCKLCCLRVPVWGVCLLEKEETNRVIILFLCAAKSISAKLERAPRSNER